MSGAGSILGRIWLIIVNFLLLAIGGLSVFAGWAYLKYYNDSDANIAFVELNMKVVAWCFFGFGAYVLIAALSGCIGGCTRSNGALRFYMGLLGLGMLVVAGAGGYGIYTLTIGQRSWNSISAATFTAADDLSKDGAQIMFACCGFTSYNQAYTGPHLISAFKDIPNACADASSFEASRPCSPAGDQYYSTVRRYLIIGLCVSLAVIILSIVAAEASRRKWRVMGYGAPAYQPMPAGYAQPQPYMAKV